MSTQNIYQYRAVWTNLAAATYYCPFHIGAVVSTYFSATKANAWIDCDGFDNLSIMGQLVAGAADTLTVTVWSDDAVGDGLAWNETPGGYDSLTNTFPANYLINNGTLRFHVHFDDCGGKRFQVQMVVAGGVANSGILTFRPTKR